MTKIKINIYLFFVSFAVDEPREHTGEAGFLRMRDLDFGDGPNDGIKMATLAKAPTYLLK